MTKMPKTDRAGFRRLAAALVAIVLLAGGCAGVAPVPGGTDTENLAYYDSKEYLLSLLSTLKPGTPEPVVFQRLDRKRSDFTILKRDEVMTALLGTSNVEVRNSASEQDISNSLLQTLYGYRLNYTNIERRHGFTNPIRIRTDESGFSYTVILIFRQGRLFERPIVTGGIVNKNSSKTIFDYFNPGTLLGRVP